MPSGGLGTACPNNMRTALEELWYICDGERREYAAGFTFHGFRYVKATGRDL